MAASSIVNIGPAGSYYQSIIDAGFQYSLSYCYGFPRNVTGPSTVLPMIWTSKYTEERGTDGMPIAKDNLNAEEQRQLQGIHGFI